MRRKSPQTVTYTDLVAIAKEWRDSYQRQHDSLRGIGARDASNITHKLECAKTLVRLLKKCEPGRQADLFQLFEETR